MTLLLACAWLGAIVTAYVVLGWFAGWPCWWWRIMGVRAAEGPANEWALHVTPGAWE